MDNFLQLSLIVIAKGNVKPCPMATLNNDFFYHSNELLFRSIDDKPLTSMLSFTSISYMFSLHSISHKAILL